MAATSLGKQLDKSYSDHHQTRKFLNELRNLGMEKRGEEFVNLVTPIEPMMNGDQEEIDDQLIKRRLLAEQAESEGLLVSDSMIDQYLFGTYGVLDGDGMSTRDLELLNRRVNNGQISMAAVRRQLKTELLYQKMNMLSRAGIPRVPNPSESIQHYAKMTQKMEGEIFPVSIKDYIDESAMPSQTEIRSLYDEGKYDLKDPTGEQPGFKLPRRVKMQYFVGSYQDFLDKATADLSDEEIQAKYDELVAQESDLVMEIVPDESSIEDEMPPINLEGDDDGDSADADDDGESDEAPKPGDADAGADADVDDSDQSYKVNGDSNFVLVSMPAQEETPAVDPPAVPEIEIPAVGEVEAPIGEAVEAGGEAADTAVEAAVDAVQTDSPTETPATEVPATETPATDAPPTENSCDRDACCGNANGSRTGDRHAYRH